MKILDLCEFFSERGGGVRSYLTRQARAASARGHELVVVAPGPRDEVVVENGGRVVRYRAPRMPYDPTYHAPIGVRAMRRIVASERPDVIQVSSPFVPALVARTIRHPAKVYFYHSDPIGTYVRPTARALGVPERRVERALGPAWRWMRAVCNGCTATVTSGHWLTALLTQQGCQRVHTVPFGIDHDSFSPSRANKLLRERLLGPLAPRADAKLLLVAGRLAMDKRQALLIDAVRHLCRRRAVALVVVGDGPERPRLERLATDLPAVTFIPFTRDRAEYAAILASADALIHASLGETFGFVIAETLASGTPVVVPREGGAPEIVDAACAELYAPRADAHEVAAAIHRLLGRPEDALRDGALHAARRHPTTEAHFDMLFDFYRHLANNRTDA